MKSIINQGFKSLAVLCLISNLNPFSGPEVVKADQPVHCLREQMFGQWKFHVAKQTATVDLFDTAEVCSHNIPNKVQVLSENFKFNFAGEDVYQVNLIDNYKAEAVFCKDGASCDGKVIQGKWTSIYDQAIDLELDNGIRFIANMRYNMKSLVSKDPLKQAFEKGLNSFGTIESGDYDKFNS